MSVVLCSRPSFGIPRMVKMSHVVFPLTTWYRAEWGLMARCVQSLLLQQSSILGLLVLAHFSIHAAARLHACGHMPFLPWSLGQSLSGGTYHRHGWLVAVAVRTAVAGVKAVTSEPLHRDLPQCLHMWLNLYMDFCP